MHGARASIATILATITSCVAHECVSQVSTINLTHASQPQLGDFRQSIVTHWDELRFEQPTCYSLSTSLQRNSVEDSRVNPYIGGLEILFREVGHAFPASITQGDWFTTMDLLGSINTHLEEVNSCLSIIWPSLRLPDFEQAIRRASDDVSGGTDRALVNILRSWFWPILDRHKSLKAVIRDLFEPELRHSIQRHLPTTRSSKDCLAAKHTLDGSLSCFRIDAERLRANIQHVSDAMGVFLDGMEREPATGAAGSTAWGEQHRVSLIQLCIDMQLLFGVGQLDAEYRCYAGPDSL